MLDDISRYDNIENITQMIHHTNFETNASNDSKMTLNTIRSKIPHTYVTNVFDNTISVHSMTSSLALFDYVSRNYGLGLCPSSVRRLSRNYLWTSCSDFFKVSVVRYRGSYPRTSFEKKNTLSDFSRIAFELLQTDGNFSWIFFLIFLIKNWIFKDFIPGILRSPL